MSDRSDLVWDVRGFCGPLEHGYGDDIQGEAKTMDTMTILWVGVHSGVYDGALEMDVLLIHFLKLLSSRPKWNRN